MSRTLAALSLTTLFGAVTLPGGDALASRSLSAYLLHRSGEAGASPEYTVISNIYEGGSPPLEAGAGIVADSVPELEYDETCNKARAMMKAIELAEQGLD